MASYVVMQLVGSGSGAARGLCIWFEVARVSGLRFEGRGRGWFFTRFHSLYRVIALKLFALDSFRWWSSSFDCLVVQSYLGRSWIVLGRSTLLALL